MEQRDVLALLLSVLLLATTIAQATNNWEAEVVKNIQTTPEIEETSKKLEAPVSIGAEIDQPDVEADSASEKDIKTKQQRLQAILATKDQNLLNKGLLKFSQPVISPPNALNFEIDQLSNKFIDRNNATEASIQDEVGKVIKAQAEKTREDTIPAQWSDPNKSTKDRRDYLLHVLKAKDITYLEPIDEVEDTVEQNMFNCPDGCTCYGPFWSKSIKCIYLDDTFDSQTTHLAIANAISVNLGPRALHKRRLTKLQTLMIRDTFITEVNQTAFSGIPYLSAINFTRTGPVNIDHDAFQPCAQLNALILSEQTFEPHWLKKRDYLFAAPALKELWLTDSELEILPSKAFHRMPKLTFLNLAGNRLHKLERSAFAPLKYLQELDLSRNRFTIIPEVISEFKQLNTLKIVNSHLQSLSIKSENLQILDLSVNMIEKIEKDDFAHVPEVKDLKITRNGLEEIHPHAFSRIPKLTHLDISNNRLRNWTDRHLIKNPNLQTLIMSRNPELKTLPIFKAHGSKMNAFQLFRFDCNYCGLEEIHLDTFRAMPAITILNLAGNSIKTLRKGLLASLNTLNVLDLSKNQIESISPNMFVGATVLTHLNLAGNPIIGMAVTPFLETRSLTNLNVDDCDIQRLWTEARQPLKSLKHLSIRANLLERITQEELKAMPELESLQLAGNPLVCDDDFEQAITWIAKEQIMPVLNFESMDHRWESHTLETADVHNWTDLVLMVCESEELEEGPPLRPLPRLRPVTLEPDSGLDVEDAADLSKDDLANRLDDNTFTLVNMHTTSNDEMQIWEDQDSDVEYEELYSGQDGDFHYWYHWGLVFGVVLIAVLAVGFLVVSVKFVSYMANRKGRTPVIRPPLILRQGLVDNKNCGLVYKPLQEEIPTPHMPKRGSFYSSSTFHYDKIVPESV